MVKSENYINIQGWMVTELNLKGNKLFLYAIIYGFSQGIEGQCYSGSVSYLADWTNSTRQGVMKALKELEDAGLIKGLREKEGSTKTVRYLVNKVYKNMSTKFTSTSKQSLHNNIDDNLVDKKNIKKSSVITVDELDTREKDDRVPITRWGKTWEEFQVECPQEFKNTAKVMFPNPDSQYADARDALNFFYEQNKTSRSMFPEWKWADILIKNLNKQKK